MRWIAALALLAGCGFECADAVSGEYLTTYTERAGGTCGPIDGGGQRWDFEMSPSSPCVLDLDIPPDIGSNPETTERYVFVHDAPNAERLHGTLERSRQWTDGSSCQSTYDFTLVRE